MKHLNVFFFSILGGSIFLAAGCFQMSTPYGLTSENQAQNPISNSGSSGGSVGTSRPAPVSTASFSSLNANIFQTKCVSCHSSTNKAGNYDMSTYAAILSEVTVGSPQNSLLYQRVNDNSMPPGAPLSTADLTAIALWITDGALNDMPSPTPASSPVAGASPTPIPTPTATPSPVQLVATYSSISTNILSLKCVSCHNTNNMAGGYSYSDYAATLKSVVVGSATTSHFYTAIQRSMPPSGPLTTLEISIIQTWINDGALNN